MWKMWPATHRWVLDMGCRITDAVATIIVTEDRGRGRRWRYALVAA
jgi:hypothetical protein